MKILRTDRQMGKTGLLIKKSHDEWRYIICKDRQRVEVIQSMAVEMKLYIPFPIMVDELPLLSHNIKEVLVDDIEDVLEYMIGKKIELATTSCKIITKEDCINEIKNKKELPGDI